MKSLVRVALVAATAICPATSLLAQASAAPRRTASAVAHGTYSVVPGSGDTIIVTVRGAGPAVVLVPGLLGGAHTFRHVSAGLLEAGHRVAIVEPLGMGRSARPETADYTLEAQAGRVLEAMDALGIGSATLVCHSVGGSICYRLALREPARVSGIVSISGGPDEEAATDGLRRALKFAPLIKLLGSGSMRGRLKDGLIESSADPSWVTEETVREYTAPYGDLGRALRGLRGMAEARDTTRLAPRLPDLAVPIILLVGTGGREPSMKPEVVAGLEQAIPRITVKLVDDAGQYIQEENPAAVIAAVRALRPAK